jgi:ABC-type sugar transport system substrate-binding protein
MLRKKLALLLLALFLCCLGVGVAGEKKITIAMAINTGNIPFMVPLRQGANDAAKDLGINVEWLSPPTADVNQLTNLLENLISRKVDGIALQAPNWESVANVVEKIRAANIPVLAVNNNLPGSGLTFVGQDNIPSGELLGQELVKALSGEGDWATHVGLPKKTPAGEIIFYIDLPGQLSLEQRMHGIENVTKKYPGLKVAQVYDVTTRGSAAAKRVVDDAMTRYPNLAAHASVVGMGTAMAGQVVKERDLVGKCVVVGWDLLEPTLEQIKEGIIAAAIGQNPHAQGYQAVKTLYENIVDKKPMPEVVDTSAEIVTIKNVDEVLKREFPK